MAQSEQGRSVSASVPRPCAWPPSAAKSMRYTPCRTDLGSSAALSSTAPRRKRSSIAPETAQNTPRDRILINKISFLQWHRVMGVMKRGCIRPTRHRDRSAARQGCDRSFCGTQPDRTRPRRCDESVRRCRWSAGSWSWCGCDRCPRPRGELVFVALGAAKLGAAIGQHARQPDPLFVVERYHPVVEDLGRSDRGLAIIELGEATLA